jgi:hypothetical protein
MQYIGPTAYLTVVTATDTVSGKLAAIPTSLEYTVATATVAVGDDAVGDVSVVISPKLKSSWLDLAVKHCGAPSKRIKRTDFASCALDYVNDAAASDGSFDLIGPPRLPTVTAADIAESSVTVWLVGKFVASNEGIATLALIALAAWYEEGQKDMPTTLKIPVPQVQSATATSTGSSCPPQQTDKVSLKVSNLWLRAYGSFSPQK